MAHSESVFRNLLDKIIIEQKYEDCNIEVTPISSGGANYTSHLFLATLTSKKGDKINLFAKVASLGEKLRAQAHLKIYTTEQIFYEKLLKLYQQIEEKHGVPEEHRLNVPKFYGCYPNPLEETIVLEDLTCKGFTMHDRIMSVDWEYAAAAVGELAKLHALSMAYQHEQPQEFQQILGEIKVEWRNNTNPRDMLLKSGLKIAKDGVKKENKEKFEKFFNLMNGESFQNYYTLLRRAVIAHGDFKYNNLMHRVNSEGRVQVKVVDYQMMQGYSPVVDLLFFIFTSTDKQFRAAHYKRLLDHYHAQLSLALQRLHLDPDEEYSREDFDYELKEILPLGLIIAVYVLPLITAETKALPEMGQDVELSSFAMHDTTELYTKRINEVIDDYVAWGVLK